MYEYTRHCAQRNQKLEIAHHSVGLHDRHRVHHELYSVSAAEVEPGFGGILGFMREAP